MYKLVGFLYAIKAFTWYGIFWTLLVFATSQVKVWVARISEAKPTDSF
jgi:succinate-acetate transporter protein